MANDVWIPCFEYSKGDVVSYRYFSYEAVRDVPRNVNIGDPDYWQPYKGKEEGAESKPEPEPAKKAAPKKLAKKVEKAVDKEPAEEPDAGGEADDKRL
jgi:NMD protein affecting ribosome stability and mRNA decay